MCESLQYVTLLQWFRPSLRFPFFVSFQCDVNVERAMYSDNYACTLLCGLQPNLLQHCAHTHTHTEAVKPSLRHWLLFSRTHTGHLCQQLGLNGDPLPKKRKREARGDRVRVGSQVVPTPSSLLNKHLHTVLVCLWGLSSPSRPFLPIQQGLISKWVRKGGAGGYGRREKQANHLGSALFVVLFLRATQEDTKQHKRESPVPFSWPPSSSL